MIYYWKQSPRLKYHKVCKAEMSLIMLKFVQRRPTTLFNEALIGGMSLEIDNFLRFVVLSTFMSIN